MLSIDWDVRCVMGSDLIKHGLELSTALLFTMLAEPKKPITFACYVDVLLDSAIHKSLEYGVLPEMADRVRKGCRVMVPVRGSLRSGYILDVKQDSTFPSVKAIADVLSTEPLLTSELFDVALWMADYYCSPLSHVLKVMLPSSLREKVRAKEQQYVMRAKTRDEMADICRSLRARSPKQVDVLDVMLKVRKGILLTELLEQAGTSRAPVDSLVKKGLLLIDIVRTDRSPFQNEEYFRTKPKTLSGEQAASLKATTDLLNAGRFGVNLLYGVTGSGKTEIYLQAIDYALCQGKGAIMLVPEISLTPQTMERFRSRFDNKIAILHHRLSHGERHDEWHRILRGDASIVIGARSAIFSPVKNLGVVVVDEEHESSYKQNDSAPCYHARDVAVMRAKLEGAAVILGSATPSLESFHNSQSGKYHLSRLSTRPDASKMPTVRIVDMRLEREKAGGYALFSQGLLEGIKARHGRGEQCILFLNRRGYHTSMLCGSCEHVVECPRCDVALTFHKNDQQLSCHLCGHTLCPPPATCPECGAPDTLKYRGVGTQQVEKALYAMMPGVRIIRMDADSTRHKGSHQQLLRDFGSGKADVLVGTQMIAKGLHFPQVTLVGILNSDAALNIPDFRASETVFQLITQVSGRSGRGDAHGEVIIQTMLPDNRTLELAAEADTDTFFEEELNVREAFNYPPYQQMVKVVFTGTDSSETVRTAEELRKLLIFALPQDCELHPTLPCGYARVKDRFRFQFVVQGPRGFHLRGGVLETALKKLRLPRNVRMLVDVNPLSTYF